MKEIYIIGASGLAKEIANYVLDVNYNIEGFVEKDENFTKKELIIRGVAYPIIKESSFFKIILNIKYKPQAIIAVGLPFIRNKIYTAYKDFCSFPNIIHPKATICDTSIEWGIGNIVAPGCILTTSIRIGSFNLFNISSTIGHDVQIGDYNVLNPLVSISGEVKIGNQNLIGCNAAIIQGIQIGNNNTIGMGAAVLKDIKDSLTIVGIPAKPVIK